MIKYNEKNKNIYRKYKTNKKKMIKKMLRQ